MRISIPTNKITWGIFQFRPCYKKESPFLIPKNQKISSSSFPFPFYICSALPFLTSHKHAILSNSQIIKHYQKTLEATNLCSYSRKRVRSKKTTHNSRWVRMTQNQNLNRSDAYLRFTLGIQRRSPEGRRESIQKVRIFMLKERKKITQNSPWLEIF